MLVIVNYGIGNIGSIKNMLKKVGHRAVVSSSRDDVARADRLILSGMGSFDSGMEFLNQNRLIDVLHEKVLEKRTPLLGICLGMQVLTEKSEEGSFHGLGFIKGETVRFSVPERQEGFRIPHMGWNTVDVKKKSALFEGLYGETRFYFAHSYHVLPAVPSDILATTCYGYEFTSCVQKDNIVGVQFHPEKSHLFGMKLLRNFIERI
ncbi:MAG: imidazole glycerol phosphate synthase subunit HisH [Candidatus Aureabacteria bacterium]|nr:imidazole glycerol phosphate synthase subunit HisH [Candidatus Auribacterota bacterium]